MSSSAVLPGLLARAAVLMVTVLVVAFLELWKPGKEEVLIAGAAGESQAVLLGEVVRGADLDGQIGASKSFIKLTSV